MQYEYSEAAESGLRISRGCGLREMQFKFLHAENPETTSSNINQHTLFKRHAAHSLHSFAVRR